MNDGYIMLVTYNHSTGYISVPCATEKEGIEVLNEYLDREKRAVERLFGYTPAVRKHGDTEAVLYCIDDPGRISAGTDTATYRVIKARHCADEDGDGVKTWFVVIDDGITGTVNMKKIAGTKHRILKYLAKTARQKMEQARSLCRRLSGDTFSGSIRENGNGELCVLSCFSRIEDRLVIKAYPEDKVPEADFDETLSPEQPDARMDELTLPDGTKVYVDSGWLYGVCMEYAYGDGELRGEGHEDSTAHGEALYENMGEDTEAEIIREALMDVGSSKIESGDPVLSLNIRMLSVLQGIAGRKEDSGIEITLCEGEECSADGQFELSCGTGKIHGVGFGDACSAVKAWMKDSGSRA